MESRGSLRCLPAIGCALALTSCAPPPERVPIQVPFGVVGGARPAIGSGVQLGIELGDGVWGQEQERVELGGVLVGASALDRVEVTASWHAPTRSEQRNTDWATAFTVAGKVVAYEFDDERAAVGVRVGYASATKVSSAPQDETMTAWDLAVPVERRLLAVEGEPGQGLFGYVGPRVVFEEFRDNVTREETSGSSWGGVLGMRARRSLFVVSGELNLVRTPPLALGSGAPHVGGWTVLPAINFRLVVGSDRR